MANLKHLKRVFGRFLLYLDLENSAVDNVAFGGNDKYLNAMDKLRTLVFPNADGLVIPASAFENNQYLETVIFPDRPDRESEGTGTYEIMAYAFKNSAVKLLFSKRISYYRF